MTADKRVLAVTIMIAVVLLGACGLGLLVLRSSRRAGTPTVPATAISTGTATPGAIATHAPTATLRPTATVAPTATTTAVSAPAATAMLPLTPIPLTYTVQPADSLETSPRASLVYLPR